MRFHRFIILAVLLSTCGVPPRLLAQAPPATYPRMVDVGVAGITLNFRQSSHDVLGETIRLEEVDKRRRRVVCVNAASTEQLELVHHDGRGTNSFQEFRVQKYSPAEHVVAEESNSPPCRIAVDQFKSARGVTLGMSLSEITTKFGNRFRVDTQGSTTILTYALETNLSSPFLQHYSALSYYGRYFFRKGVLVQFSFGIDNL